MPKTLNEQMIQAVEDNDVTAVVRLISWGVDLSQQNNLLLLVKSEAIAKLLLDNGAAINNAPLHAHFDTPILHHIYWMRTTLDNSISDPRYTPTQEKYQEVTKIILLLISRGAAINMQDGHEAPLHLAYDGVIAQALIDAGAKVNAFSDWYGTALHNARTADVVKVLLDNGADISAKDRDGKTALHMFLDRLSEKVEERFLSICKLLMAKGASLESANIEGVRPIFDDAKLDEIKKLIEAADAPILATVKEGAASAAAQAAADITDAIATTGSEESDRDSVIPLGEGAEGGYVNPFAGCEIA